MVVSIDATRTRTVGTGDYVLDGRVDGFFLHGLRNPGATDCD